MTFDIPLDEFLGYVTSRQDIRLCALKSASHIDLNDHIGKGCIVEVTRQSELMRMQHDQCWIIAANILDSQRYLICCLGYDVGYSEPGNIETRFDEYGLYLP